MTSMQANKRGGRAVIAVLLCALVAGLGVVASPAAAEEGDAAPLRPMSEGGWSFPEISGPTAPEEYPVELDLDPELKLRQLDERAIAVEYFKYGVVSFVIETVPAHDRLGTAVPTTVKISGENIITLVVHHRAGNPAAGGAPFTYPVSGGTGWEGGFYSVGFEMNEPRPTPSVETVAPAVPEPCEVPALHGLSLAAAKAHLRAAHCSIGQIRLAAGATAGKGKVVKQFRSAGSELAAGASVAVKLGAR